MSAPLLLTGASGWFGRTALWEYEREHGPEALRRDVIPYASRERMVDFDSPHGPVKALPLEAIHEVQNPRGLLHLAFLTRDKVEELGLRRYVDTNRAITAHVAQVLQAWPSMPVVTTSSGAAAALDGRPPDLEGNPYATLKQEEELLLQREAATRMAMVFRVYAATGRFMTRPEKFALGDFLLQALSGERIRIRAKRRVVRGYVHAGALLKLILKLMRNQKQDGYRVINAISQEVDLKTLANIIASHFGTASVGERIDPSLTADIYTAPADELLNLSKLLDIQIPNLLNQVIDTSQGLAMFAQGEDAACLPQNHLPASSHFPNKWLK